MSASKTARRRALAALIAVCALAAGCASDDDGDSASSSPESAASTPAEGSGDTGTSTATGDAGAPKKGGTITIGVEAETDLFDPGNGNLAQPGRSIVSLIMGSITAADADGNYVPYMAESVTPNADATEWTIGLREGMTFHDGTPYDAEAVKYSMDRIRTDTANAGAFEYITAVDVVDPTTVKVTLSKSNGQFTQVLADALGNIVPKSAIDKYGDDFGNHPEGAGPYKVKEFVRDDHLTLERFDDYFLADKRAWADTIIFKPIPDDAARAAALEAGDVDVIATLNPGDIQSFKDKDGYTVFERPFGASGLLFSEKNIPDIRIRQAAAMAVDKDAIKELVYSGLGAAVETPFPEDSFWHTDVDAPEYNPEEAKKLVDEVKAEGGDTAVEILSSVDETATNYKMAAAEQMRAVGLDVTVVNATDANDYVNRYIEGTYDIFTGGVFAVIDPWFEYTRRFRSDSILNGTGFVSPELDAALDLGAASTDPDERKKAYDEVQQILAENVIQVFVHENSYAIIANDKIKGFGTGVNPDGSISLMNFFTAEIADEYWRDDA